MASAPDSAATARILSARNWSQTYFSCDSCQGKNRKKSWRGSVSRNRYENMSDIHMILKKALGQYSMLHPPMISSSLPTQRGGNVPSERAYSPYQLPNI